MGTDEPRLEALRRRVQEDPAAIVFAQLAEEYRRAGQCEEAVRVGRAGLIHHPKFLSARVTLGRALIELGAYEAARAELAHVVGVAPDNFAAVNGLARLDELQPAQENPVRHTVQPAGPERSEVEVSLLPDVEDLDPGLAALEAWLAQLEAERATREGQSGSVVDGSA